MPKGYPLKPVNAFFAKMLIVLLGYKMNKKDQKLSFRLSNEDAEKLKIITQDSGLSASEFIRKVILNNEINIIKKEDTIKVIYHLNKMGNNLNQIAHGINKAFLENIVTEELMEKYLRQLNMVQNQQRLFLDLLKSDHKTWNKRVK